MARHTFLVLVTILLVVIGRMQAQVVERDLPRRGVSAMEGTSFVLGFMQNEIQLPAVDDSPYSLQVHISSEYDARVTIRSGESAPFDVNIAAGTSIVRSITDDVVMLRSQVVQRKAVFIDSDAPIVVIVTNFRETSSDSYLAIPTRHLGRQYLVASYRNGAYQHPSPDLTKRTDSVVRQGEFLVVATEANTLVEITPSVDTDAGNRAGVPFPVLLQRGDCYLVKSNTLAREGADLTTSVVTSDKPVAVYSGHLRAAVVSVPDVQTSKNRDHLAEMLPPVDKLGRSHSTIPFAFNPMPDIVRVIPVTYPTRVLAITATGVVPFNLVTPGSFIEVEDVDEAYAWESDQPVAVYQYMKSNHSAAFVSAQGDPSMAWVPPYERFVNRVTFHMPPLLRQTNTTADQYLYGITVVADHAAMTSLRLNGQLLTEREPTFAQRTVPGSGLYYTRVMLGPDVLVRMECDSGRFSGLAYGVGPNDSYAHPYGMTFDSLVVRERIPPRYTMAVDCPDIAGFIRDSMPDAGSKLLSVDAMPQLTYNMNVSIGAAEDTLGSRRVQASIRDRLVDAKLVIHAYDDAGNGRSWEYTYDAPRVRIPSQVVMFSSSVRACTTVAIVNTDTTPARVVRIGLVGDARYSIAPDVRDSLLQPGDSIQVTICFDPPYVPQATPSNILLTFPCDLTMRIPIVISNGALLTTEDVDFGPVRIGDTACDTAYIVNSGTVAMEVTALGLAALLEDMSVGVAAMVLPQTLQPGQRLAVPVCFTPMAQRVFERRDTVGSAPPVGVTVGYRGRGIRPLITASDAEWGEVAVGCELDSVVTMVNQGEATGTIRLLEAIGDRMSFDITAFTTGAIVLKPAESALLRVRFLPTAPGPRTLRLRCLVDWRFHDTVDIVLHGTGVETVLQTFDVNLGRIRLGSQGVIDNYRVVQLGGDRSIVVQNVQVSGPDVGAFGLAPELMTLNAIAAGGDVAGTFTFTPTRVGVHTMTVTFDHNAAVCRGLATANIRLTGEGYDDSDPGGDEDTIDGRARLAVPVVVNACQTYEGTVTVETSGNVDRVVVGIDVSVDGTSAVLEGTPIPFLLPVGASETVRYTVLPSRPGQQLHTITVRWADGGDTLLTAVVDVRAVPAGLSVTPELTIDPGGTARIDIVADIPDPLAIGVEPTITIPLAADRLYVDAASVDIAVRDALGQRQMPFVVDRTPDAIVLRASSPIVPPARLEGQLTGLFVWKDPYPMGIVTSLDVSDCHVVASGTTAITTDLCGDVLRMVQFDALPLVSMTVMEQPSREGIVLRFESTMAVDCRLILQDVDGRQMTAEEKFSLNKGTTVSKFPCSTWASGMYRLVLQHRNGEVVVPLIVIK